MTASPPLSVSQHHRIALGACYGVTDTGLVRDVNEDNFLIDDHLSLLMVADGMGGHTAGALASAEAIVSIQAYLAQASKTPPSFTNTATDDNTIPLPHLRNNDAESIVRQAVINANAHVYALNLARQNAEGCGMGTTMTGIWQRNADPVITLFHVGDSRFYRFRAGRLNCLTHDQTLYQRALDAGETLNLPKKNMLWQALGPYADIAPAIQSFQWQAGDRYLLCSDGLHAAVPHEQIEQLMATAQTEQIDFTCQQLIGQAKAYGGRDNITAIVIQSD